MTTIWVYADVSGGSLHPSALELLTKAREIGDNVEAVALGPGASESVSTLGEYGAEVVYAGDDEAFANHLAQPAAEALHQLVQQYKPDVIMFSMTYDSRDVAGRLQGKTGSTLLSNATDISGPDRAQTQIFGGTTIVDVDLRGPDPRLVLFRPKAFDPSPSGGTAEVVPVQADIPKDLRKATVVERHEEAAAGPKLEEAPVIISGGRGLQDPSNFELLRQLAEAIGKAAVGATRAVVDSGWVPYAMQIGQTGTTVKPDVYIAIGISGATQHMVGMKESKRIIAINKDPEAPIFKISDLGVVGDALKIVPKVIEEIKAQEG